MDLLKILLDPNNIKSACFLCFEQNEDSMSVFQKLFIHAEFEASDTTLSSIMNYLFPSHDILFSQACQACSSFLIKSFILLRRHSMISNILSKITRVISREIDYAAEKNTTSKQFKIKLELNDIQTPDKCSPNETKPIKGEHIPELPDNCQLVVENQYCRKCDMKFNTKKLLKQHEKIAHRNSNEGAVCEFCGKDCVKPSTLKVHLNCHKEKTCPYCLKTLKLHAHYKTHIKTHEGHIKKRLKKSQYSCNVCPYKSLNKHSLDAHINKMHLQTRPYICAICYKGFYKKSNLTEHALIHENVKNLTCEQCGDSFATKKTLNEHLRLHSGERPFQCAICNLTFVTAGRRSEHFKRKHMEKTICCFICDRKFSLKRELNSHIKKVHGQSKAGESISLSEPNHLFNDS